MSISNERREVAIERMADHILSQGLAGATLRPLAAAAGTSDRMLLYYFADKDELLTAVLDRIAARLLLELEDAISIGPPRPFAILLEQVWAVLGSEHIKPYMNVWLDLASNAARNLQPYRNVASAIADGYIAWVASRLERQGDGAPAGSAALLLSAIQGMYLFTAAGRPAIAGSALIELLACSMTVGDGTGREPCSRAGTSVWRVALPDSIPRDAQRSCAYLHRGHVRAYGSPPGIICPISPLPHAHLFSVRPFLPRGGVPDPAPVVAGGDRRPRRRNPSSRGTLISSGHPPGCRGKPAGTRSEPWASS